MSQTKLLIVGVVSILVAIGTLVGFSLREETAVSMDYEFPGTPYDITLKEFQYIENNTRSSTREILDALVNTNSDIEKTIKLLNDNNPYLLSEDSHD